MKNYRVEISVVRQDEENRPKWAIVINDERVPGEFFSSDAAKKFARTVLRSDYTVEPSAADWRTTRHEA